MAFFKFPWLGERSQEREPAPMHRSRAAQTLTVEQMRVRARHRLLGAAVLVAAGVIGFPLLFDSQPRPIPVDIPIEIPDRNKVAPLVVPGEQVQSQGATPDMLRTAQLNDPVPLDEQSLDDGEELLPASPIAPIPQPPQVLPTPPAAPLAAPAPTAPTPAAAVPKQEPKPKPETKSAPKPEPKPEIKPAPKPEPKVETKPEPKPVATPSSAEREAARARALLEGKPLPAAATAPAAAAPASASQNGRFIVQVGAFAEVSTANDVRRKLESAGLKTYTQTVATSAGQRTRVRVGPFNSREEAARAAERAKALGLNGTVLSP